MLTQIISFLLFFFFQRRIYIFIHSFISLTVIIDATHCYKTMINKIAFLPWKTFNCSCTRSSLLISVPESAVRSFSSLLLDFLGRISLCNSSSCPGTSSCRPGWLWTHRDLLFSASQVLGLKVCMTTSQLQMIFIKSHFLYFWLCLQASGTYTEMIRISK